MCFFCHLELYGSTGGKSLLQPALYRGVRGHINTRNRLGGLILLLHDIFSKVTTRRTTCPLFLSASAYLLNM